MPGCWNKVGFDLMVKETQERLLREQRRQSIMEMASHKAAKNQDTFNAYIKTGVHYPTYLPPPRPRKRPLTASACLHEIQQYMNFYNVMEERDTSRQPGDPFYEGDWSIGDASSTTEGVYLEPSLNQIEAPPGERIETVSIRIDGTVDPPRPATTGSINESVTRRTFHLLDCPERQVRSGGGTRTMGSLAFTSGVLGFSTPLYCPATPPMPNIDDHVTVKQAKWSEVCMTLRQARSEHLTMRIVPKMPEVEDKKPIVSTDEMKLVFNYIDNYQGGDGLIEYGEMETAFRRARRARAAAALAQEGRKLLERLEKVFAFHRLTVKRFFFRLDINCNGQGDGKLSMSEIKRGLAHLTELEDLTEYRFTDHELQTLIRYMDPNADGTLTLGEMEDAFIRAHAPMQELEVQERVGRVIAELDAIMAKRKKRLIDLFRELDTDGSGAISLQELKEGLERAAQPAPEVRARRKIRFKKDIVANQNDAMHRAQVDQIKARFRAAKDSGALPVLMRLEAYLHANKLRSRDIFTKAGFDSSGDGQVDAREFHQALERLNINIRKKEVFSVLAFLDVNHDNRIQPSELEGAMRDLTKAKALLQPRGRHSQLNKHHSHRLAKGDSLRRLMPIPASIPMPASRPRTSGKLGGHGMPDVRWLESFDHLMTHHLKKLTRCN